MSQKADYVALQELVGALSPSALPDLDRKARWRTERAHEPRFANVVGDYPFADAARLIRGALRVLNAAGVQGWWTGHSMLADPPAPGCTTCGSTVRGHNADHLCRAEGCDRPTSGRSFCYVCADIP